ncbi:hypothetical protein GCM10009868_04440 [Terrabacter aerolatus]|uniref:Uncharacterized protein n=1 Tax=Terrabacter aerolatus TaxID=422442 RepID=A0A512CZ93_9MICO|nr:hypothetical protein [Terrabacter aerolatus]GEO29533.1 hypothetical protein TAE01_13430 [Terrabacter aerolatus]
MTAVSVPGVDPASRLRIVGPRLVPWLLALVAVTVAMAQTGVPALDLLRYGAYLVLGLALPGTLVLRSLVRQRRSLVEDAALGTVVGCVLELVSLVAATLLGVQHWLRVWPAAVIVVFAAVPRLRRHWRRLPGETTSALPRLWHWGVATASAVSAVGVVRLLGGYRLPPSDGSYYQDLLWHLGIVRSIERSIPPEIPQVSGELLRYHWFSHAQMAAGHLVSGAPDATIIMRLWPAAFTVLAILAAATLARELSGVWWTGPVAAWIIAVAGVAQILPVTAYVNALSLLSFSQTYVVAIALAAATLTARALRGERLGAGWVAVAGMLVLASGSKPTAVPMLVAGAAAVIVIGLLLDRSWIRPALVLLGIGAVILPVSSRLVSGSDSGSRISLFDFMEWVPLYHQLTGASFRPATGPILPEGVSDLSTRSVEVLALVLVTQFVPLAAVLASAVAFRHRSVRSDPAAWFMLGIIGSGLTVYLVLSHPALSQLYFLSLAVAFFGPVLAWGMAATVERVPGRPAVRAAVVVAGVAIGWSTAVLALHAAPVVPAGQEHSLEAWTRSILVPIGVVVAVVLVLGLVVLVLRRTGRLPAHVGVALLVTAAVLGAPMAASGPVVLDRLQTFVRQDPLLPGGGLPLPRGGGAALDWLQTNTPEDAVVATNRHCATGVQRAGCASLAFYVSGLGGRQVVLEGWGYTSLTGGLQVATRWPERLADNDALFTDPTAAGFARLRDEFGLGWLVADTSAGPVSPRITKFATPRFHAGTVTVYEIDSRAGR